MKQLESILNQKSEPLSAATSAAASIPEVPEEYEEEVQVHLEEDEEEEVESKNKVPSASLFSNQSARESTNSVQSFHLSKSHTSSAVNRFSIATLDGDKTPVLQMTDGKFDNDETPKLERELERNERAVQEANDDDDANVTITDNNVIGSTEGNKLQKIDSVSPITNSSSSLLPAPTVPSETSPLITQTEKLDAATASIPKLNVESDKSEVSGNAELEPSPAFGKSMIPDYIPRIQPPAKNTPTTYTPSTIASTTTPKQTNNSTFDSPNTRPSIISTPRTPTPRSPYGRSNSTYSLNFKAQSEAVQEKTHKRSSTLGDLSSVVKEKGEAKAPSLKKFSFKSLFKKKSSVDEVPPITQPPRKSKKPRSFSSPNLSKYTEFPTTTTTSTTTTSDKGLDGKSTPSSQNLLQKSSSSFLNVFKKINHQRIFLH